MYRLILFEHYYREEIDELKCEIQQLQELNESLQEEKQTNVGSSDTVSRRRTHPLKYRLYSVLFITQGKLTYF